MDYPNCQLFGFTQSRIDEMLRLLELKERDSESAELLQSKVIQPNIAIIINDFYSYLQQHREYNEFITGNAELNQLKQTQALYLRTLGAGFRSPDYFEERLKIGVAHHHIGLPPRLYECAYAKLKEIITSHISNTFTGDIENTLRYFLNRIITLDMSLAMESYYQIRIGDLEESVEKLEKTRTVLRERSVTDTLTGAANRAAILGFINELLVGFEKNAKTFSVVMLDVNNLRQVNEQLGHMAGDLVLKNIIFQIKSKIRTSDKIGRYGGDEFLLAFQNADAAVASRKMTEINELLSHQTVSVRNKKICTQLSYGITEVRAGDDLPAILSRVDKVLTSSKSKLQATG